MEKNRNKKIEEQEEGISFEEFISTLTKSERKKGFGYAMDKFYTTVVFPPIKLD